MSASARDEHRRVTGIGRRYGKLSRELVQPDRVKFCLRGASCRLLAPLDDMDKSGMVDCNLEQMDRFDGRILRDGDYEQSSLSTVIEEHDGNSTAFESYRDILIPIVSGRSAEEVLLQIPQADGIEEEEKGPLKKLQLKPTKLEATVAIPYNYENKSAPVSSSKFEPPVLQAESIDSYELHKDLVEQYEDLPSKLREKIGLLAKLFGIGDLRAMVLAELDDDDSVERDGAVPKPIRKRGVYDPDALPSYAVRRAEPASDPKPAPVASSAPIASAQKKPLTPMEKLRLKTQQALERTQRADKDIERQKQQQTIVMAGPRASTSTARRSRSRSPRRHRSRSRSRSRSPKNRRSRRDLSASRSRSRSRSRSPEVPLHYRRR